MSVQGHLQSLADKHHRLDEQLASETNRPRPDENTLSRLKKEKLRIKEEMRRHNA